MSDSTHRDTEPAAPRVVLAVTGGIAVYKAVEVMRGLQHAGCDVRVTMTADAERFVGTPTFEVLSGHPVADDLYAYPDSTIPHIFLADWADLVVVVPATGNVLAKMAMGIADDCLSTTLLAAHCPVLVAAAMNVHMWRNPATQANVATLRSRGIRFVMPQTGLLACGDVGEGKLAEVSDIVSAALDALAPAKQDMAGMRLVITAGPTHEAIDPVRFIANASTGKMGYTTKLVAQLMRDLGSIPAPMNSFILNLGLQSLHLRMRQHCANAQKVAEFLQNDERVAWVHYSGLEGDEYHALAQKYMPNGTCGVIAFGLKGDRETAIKFMDSLDMINIVTHVADARTCVLHPASHTHRQLSEEQLKEAGVAPDLIRLSVGIEDVEDILDDIKQALDQI